MKKFIVLSIIALNVILVICLTLNYCDSQSDSLALIDEFHSTLESLANKHQDKRILEVGANAHKALSIMIQLHNKRTYWIFGTIIGFSFLILFFYFNRSKKKKHIQQQFSELVDREQVICLGNVCYDSSSCVFYINNKKVKVRPLCTELLLYLIDASHHYANKKEICFHLWKTEEIDTSDRLRRLICDLRKLLETNNANIVIEAVINGYKLNVKEEL